MEIMVSSKLKDKPLKRVPAKLFDPLRNKYVLATPEEIIRQKLLIFMTTTLGFPKELIAVEKQLSNLPHLELEGKTDFPKRRADVICFSQEKQQGLTPFLLVECKEGRIGKEAKEQVLGYNHFVKAKYAAIAGSQEVCLIFPNCLPYLPTYRELQGYSCK